MKFLILIILMTNSTFTFANSNQLTLEDLGISQSDTYENLEAQQELELRSDYLKKHQTWGLVTLALMTTTFLFGHDAEYEKGEHESPNEIHQYLGIVSSLAYWTTFYYQYNAPKPKDMTDQGNNIKLHKALAWVHVPLMILTPISGLLAWQANKAGKDKTGLAAQKETLGGLTMASVGLAATLMIIEF